MKIYISLPVTLALVLRAYSRKSLTPFGIFAAVLTAAAHAVHPWSVFFALLVVFFLAGTAVTKVKHNVKSKLTLSSAGGSTAIPKPRNHVQVFANSIVASILVPLHAYFLYKEGRAEEQCWQNGARPRISDILVFGIVGNYAAVAADTFSSELGILSPKKPRLITAPWKFVPPGTNGAITSSGINAGLIGGFVISTTAALLLPFCTTGPNAWSFRQRADFSILMTFVGLFGSLLDSLLGALLQASVLDVRSGKIIEAEGGGKVPVQVSGSLHMNPEARLRARMGDGDGDKAVEHTVKAAGKHKGESRRVEVGRDVLSNNGVNLLMALTTSGVAIAGAAWAWDVPLSELWAQVRGIYQS
ncbi:hypothetical protein EJ06DRAFT_508595 [Trichodelitschia bisporula]|uniref:DUF92 domain protein n=1 Tax=Trichodelitschia bisporula TaxID=703511 RepID=A0A6G1HYN7_9PEZI|nr:hypothetical protein EJ06DRAFT_508595 [Trichodelitschia bisporula]